MNYCALRFLGSGLCLFMAAPVLTAQSSGSHLSNLTIYSAGVGEFLEERTIELQTGLNTLEWRSLMPKAYIRTVRVVAENAEVLRQNVTYDGAQVNNEKSAVLHLVIQNRGPVGRKRVQVDYLVPNLSWVSEHTLVLGTPPSGAAVNGPLPASFDSWVSLHNNTGVDLAAGSIDLVAGDIALLTGDSDRAYRHDEVAQSQSNVYMVDGTNVGESSGGSFTEGNSLSAFNRFTLGKNITISANTTISRFPIFQHANLAVVQRNVFENEYGVQTMGRGGFIVLPRGLEVRLVAKNAASAPLSAGQVTVYQRTGDLAQVVGQDKIGYTPQNGEFTITQGRSATLFGTRRILERKTVSYKNEEGDNHNKLVTRVEIVIHNRGTQAAEAMVRDGIERYDDNHWKITASTEAHEQLAANTVQFTVEIPAGKKKTVAYTVECK